MLGVGASVVTSTSSATNKAYFGGSLKDDGKNATDEVDIVLIQAKTIDDAYAFAQSGAGGILAGGGSIAEANGNSTTSAYIEDNSEVFWKQDVDFDVKAIGQPKVEAYADGISAGLMAVGVSEAQATASPVISA